MICYDGDGVPPEVDKDLREWIQDPDVLDTWFSSGSLAVQCTSGWPEKTPDLRQILSHICPRDRPRYPLLLGRPHDHHGTIMLSQTPPFSEVFLHGLIYGKSYWRVQQTASIAYLARKNAQKYELGETPASRRPQQMGKNVQIQRQHHRSPRNHRLIRR